MKTGTAAYWVPITVDSIDSQPHKYEGYTTLDTHDGVDEFVENSLSYFEDLFGTVVETHYIVDNIERSSDKDEYHLHLSIVVTAFFDSELDFNEKVNERFGSNLAESFNVISENVSMSGINGYDLNPLHEEPEYKEFNQ